MRETDLLRHIEARSRHLGPAVEVGPGDDCALVRLPPEAQGRVLLTVDQVVEGRHFEPGTPVEWIGRKAIARSVSDIAAMAGTPTWALATALLPPDFTRADELFDAMARWAKHFGCPLVGGDIAFWAAAETSNPIAAGALAHSKPLVLTVTVGGMPHPVRGAVLRSGGKAGDELWISGPVGGAMHPLSPDEGARLPEAAGIPRHLVFEPRVALGRALADALGPRLHAMIDVSDGVGLDASRLASASGVRAVLHAERLPLSPHAQHWRSAAGAGEDYELLFAVEPGSMADLLPTTSSTDAPTRGGNSPALIGWLEPGSGCVILAPDEGDTDAPALGWDHGQH